MPHSPKDRSPCSHQVPDPQNRNHCWSFRVEIRIPLSKHTSPRPHYTSVGKRASEASLPGLHRVSGLQVGTCGCQAPAQSWIASMGSCFLTAAQPGELLPFKGGKWGLTSLGIPILSHHRPRGQFCTTSG